MSVGEGLGGTPPTGAFELGRPALGARGWLVARQGRLGLAGLLVTSLVVCLSAAQTNMLLPASVRPLPSWLAGPFDGAGVSLGLGGLIAVFVLMFVSYAAASRAADQLSGRAVLICIAVLYAVVLLAPPLLSTDMFSYQVYARMGGLFGINPYVLGPHALGPGDPVFQYVGSKWSYIPSVYGPLFTALSYLLVPFDIAANVFAYKAIAAISSLWIVVMVWNAARLRGLDPVKAVAFVGLNPLLIVYGIGGGHNDLLMLAILVTGLYMLLQKRERTGGALIVAAAAVKLTAGLLLPFALAGNSGRRGAAHRRHHLLLGVGIATALTAALSFTLFGTGPLRLLGTLQDIQSQGGVNSIFGAISTGLGIGGLGNGAGLVLAAGFVAIVIWLLRRVWIGKLDWITGAGWATVAMLLATGLLLPWYVAWLLPLAALSTDRRLWLTTIAMTAIGLTSL